MYKFLDLAAKTAGYGLFFGGTAYTQANYNESYKAKLEKENPGFKAERVYDFYIPGCGASWKWELKRDSSEEMATPNNRR